ncbi:MAG: four helix bundle protein [Gemmatimonadales bacterium]|jgi:four helix bundle protein
MASYRDLKAWKHARQLAVECSKAAREFPDYEREGLATQLRSAAYGVPLNVAAGCTRRGSPDAQPFLETARALLAEVSTALDLASELGYIEMTRFARLEALADEASKTLYGLLRKTQAASPAIART